VSLIASLDDGLSVVFFRWKPRQLMAGAFADDEGLRR